MALYDFDRFSKHDMIGQIHVPMNSIDLGQIYETWRDLEPANDDKESFLLKISLKNFSPKNSKRLMKNLVIFVSHCDMFRLREN